MRIGRKGQPFYRIVAVDSRKRRDGAYIEKIGHYNPLTKPAEVIIDDDLALKWLDQGAIPTDTVRSLLSRRGLLLAFDLKKRGLSTEEINNRVAKFRTEKEASLLEREKAQAPQTALAESDVAPAEPSAQAEQSAETGGTEAKPSEELSSPEASAS
jgi:small subunit ribosomal protein S16